MLSNSHILQPTYSYSNGEFLKTIIFTQDIISIPAREDTNAVKSPLIEELCDSKLHNDSTKSCP